MRRRRCQPIPNSSECQVLEDRALLSATLQDGVLTLQGTAENDKLIVGVDAEAETIVAKVNGERFDFPQADVQQIVANGDAGDDYIAIGKRVGLAASIDAGDGNDRVRGGTQPDTIVGGAGNDRIAGGVGSDDIDGGEGDDKINGGVGSDTINGGDGEDSLWGYHGADVMSAGADNDFMDGGRGDDVMAGEGGDDLMRGGAGDDDMSGGIGNDRMTGGGGSNMLFGEDGDDTLAGNSNNDILDGGSGENEIRDRANGNGGGGDFVARQRAKRIFKRVDSNKDRVLTSDEVAEDRFAALLEFDADESGDIVFAEFFEWFKDKTGRGDGE